MEEETIKVLGNAYDVIQELLKVVDNLSKDKSAELRARARFVLDEINDELYKTL